jgi:DNA-binding transcriptional ArsR family regulator
MAEASTGARIPSIPEGGIPQHSSRRSSTDEGVATILRPESTSGERAGTRIFCYPVADESLTADSNTPPTRLVHLLKALADERRLRVVKRLATGSYTLQEIADEFGVAKTTMQHHLTTLRQAGIVRMKLSDYRYSLRSEVLDNLGELLGEYVKKTGDQP